MNQEIRSLCVCRWGGKKVEFVPVALGKAAGKIQEWLGKIDKVIRNEIFQKTSFVDDQELFWVLALFLIVK